MPNGSELPSVVDERWLRVWSEALRQDPELAHAGRWCDLTLVLDCDGRRRALRIEGARITATAAEPRPGWPEPVVLAGSARAWNAFLSRVPPPFHNDVLALDRRQDDFTIAAGRDEVIRHLRVLQVMFDLARTVPAQTGGPRP